MPVFIIRYKCGKGKESIRREELANLRAACAFAEKHFEGKVNGVMEDPDQTPLWKRLANKDGAAVQTPPPLVRKEHRPVTAVRSRRVSTDDEVERAIWSQPAFASSWRNF